MSPAVVLVSLGGVGLGLGSLLLVTARRHVAAVTHWGVEAGFDRPVAGLEPIVSEIVDDLTHDAVEVMASTFALENAVQTNAAVDNGIASNEEGAPAPARPERQPFRFPTPRLFGKRRSSLEQPPTDLYDLPTTHDPEPFAPAFDSSTAAGELEDGGTDALALDDEQSAQDDERNLTLPDPIETPPSAVEAIIEPSLRAEEPTRESLLGLDREARATLLLRLEAERRERQEFDDGAAALEAAAASLEAKVPRPSPQNPIDGAWAAELVGTTGPVALDTRRQLLRFYGEFAGDNSLPILQRVIDEDPELRDEARVYLQKAYDDSDSGRLRTRTL